MNILYLNNSVHLGGDTKYILKLCKEFKNIYKVFIASSGGVLLNEFNKMEIKHYYIGDVEDKSPYNILFNVKKLIQIVKKENIDLIHSNHRMTTLIAKMVSKITGVKVIHTQHLCIDNKFKLTRMSLNNIPIITVSESAKRILIEKCKLKEKSISTIYNTIETQCENKIVDSKLINLKNNGYFIVAQISRIVDYKGVYDFVEIAKQTTKENKKIKFVLIGDGPELDNIKGIVEKEKLENEVFLLGVKDNIIEHLKYIDVVILCSYIEGLPLVPLEAFSQGVPVIATNIDGTNEEIKDGYNGFLVNIKDIDGFKDNIIKLYKSKELMDKLKNIAYNTYLNYFSVDLYKKKHKELYYKISKQAE